MRGGCILTREHSHAGSKESEHCGGTHDYCKDESIVRNEKAPKIEDFIGEYNLRMYGLVVWLPSTVALIFIHLP